MNILRSLANVFAKPKAEDVVMHFVIEKLETDNAQVLVTDTAMHPVYTRLASGLAQAATGELLQVESSIANIHGNEVILAHSSFNPHLLKKVAARSSHVIFIAEYFDSTALHEEQLAEIERECDCRIDFAFMEEGRGPKTPYSPTESHYLGHKIRRMVRQRLQ